MFERMPMLCTYWPRVGKEAEVERLLILHGPALEKAGLQAPGRSVVWKARGKDGAMRFVERFDWVDAQAPATAHQLPEVMAIWEPLSAICERMDFSELEIAAGAE